MSNLYPTTPIQRCKKRFKMEEASNESPMINEDKENTDPQSPSDKKNQPIDFNIPWERNRCHSVFSESERKTVKRSTTIETKSDSLTEIEYDTSHKPPKSYFSHDHPSPIWPAVEIDQLAMWIKISRDYNYSQRRKLFTSEPIKKSKDSIEDTPYESSSSCSSGPSSDEESYDFSTTNEFQQKNLYIRSRNLDRQSDLSNLKVIGESERFKNRIIIVDCRYPYEYKGGHIIGAINLAEWPKLRNYLFGNKAQLDASHEMRTMEREEQLPQQQPRASRTVFVLHCEFSSHRAPLMFQLLREYDRLVHLTHYPALRYPKVYILRGGYAAFYARYPELCVPSSYLKMHSRPDLLSKWHRHCNLVNRKNPDFYHTEKQNRQRLSEKHIPLLSLNNGSPPATS